MRCSPVHSDWGTATGPDRSPESPDARIHSRVSVVFLSPYYYMGIGIGLFDPQMILTRVDLPEPLVPADNGSPLSDGEINISQGMNAGVPFVDMCH